jgi:predicted Zn-dependent protease
MGVGTSILPGPLGFFTSIGFCPGRSLTAHGVRDLIPVFPAISSSSGIDLIIPQQASLNTASDRVREPFGSSILLGKEGGRSMSDDRVRARGISVAATILLPLLVLTSCVKAPITGRRQLAIIPESQLLATSFSQYDAFLKEHKPVTSGPEVEMVRRVGGRIQKAVEDFMKRKGERDRLDGYEWEFNLVDSKEVNAWCMPGGKVVVYTGLLPITKDDTGLAVVLGHEIAHAVAEHGRERMSQGLLAQMGGVALDVAMANKPSQTRALWGQAYGLGAQFGALLPFSRLQESEADHLGLMFMALAGYNPSEAVPFWERMADSKKGGSPPEFLSTHPSDETRIAKIKELLPEAMKKYNKSA